MASEKWNRLLLPAWGLIPEKSFQILTCPALTLVCALLVWVYTDLLISIGYGLNHGGVNSGLQLWFGV